MEIRDDVVRVVRSGEPGVRLDRIAKGFAVHLTTLHSWIKKAHVEDGVKLETTAAE